MDNPPSSFKFKFGFLELTGSGALGIIGALVALILVGWFVANVDLTSLANLQVLVLDFVRR